MFQQPVAYVDIETSGGTMASSRIIEVAVIRVENGVITDTMQTLINPDQPLPFWITRLTGITENDLVNAPRFEEIAERLHQILDGALFIAHNVRFDYSYIKKELLATGRNFRPRLLCTVRLSRALFSEHKGHSLEAIIQRHNIETNNRHRAYDDALAIKVFAELAHAEKGDEAFAAAIAKQLKTQSVPPNLQESVVKALPNSPGVYIFEDEQGQPLYVGKSVTIRKRVLSHFTQDVKSTKEMKLSKAVHNIRAIETANELDALLLESQLVKELLPTQNRLLRRVRTQLVLVKDTNEYGYTTISLVEKDLAAITSLENIYGVYASRSKARAALEEKRRTYELCNNLLGLEHSKGACFLYQLGKCHGACVQKESAEAYNERVETALQRSRIESWPYKTAVTISDKDGNGVVVFNWIIIGYLRDTGYKSVERSFDIDTYRILRSYIHRNLKRLTITPFTIPANA